MTCKVSVPSTLFSSSIHTGSNALAEAAHFIGVLLIPGVGEFGMVKELAVVEELYCFLIHNRNG